MQTLCRQLFCPRVYVLGSALTEVYMLLRHYEQLTNTQLPCELIGVSAGDEVQLSPSRTVSVVATYHPVPSLGFIVCDNQRPIVAYLGDSSPQGLDDNLVFYDSQILITELTFVEPRHRPRMIHKHGHIHLDDLVARADRFNNELIICSHLTARTSKHQARRWISKSLPAALADRIKLI
jgi:ribonuclease Z